MVPRGIRRSAKSIDVDRASLIRVPEGHRIVASIRNDPTPTWRCTAFARDGAACPTLDVAPGRREARFRRGRPGRITTGRPRWGARPVPGTPAISSSIRPSCRTDRIRGLEWTSLTPPQLPSDSRQTMSRRRSVKASLRLHDQRLSWPATSAHLQRRGHGSAHHQLSSQTHPFHLHGFYFDVNSAGTGARSADRSGAPTPGDATGPGGTMTMTWMPERRAAGSFTAASWLTCRRTAAASTRWRGEKHAGGGRRTSRGTRARGWRMIPVSQFRIVRPSTNDRAAIAPRKLSFHHSAGHAQRWHRRRLHRWERRRVSQECAPGHCPAE